MSRNDDKDSDMGLSGQVAFSAIYAYILLENFIFRQPHFNKIYKKDTEKIY